MEQKRKLDEIKEREKELKREKEEQRAVSILYQ